MALNIENIVILIGSTELSFIVRLLYESLFDEITYEKEAEGILFIIFFSLDSNSIYIFLSTLFLNLTLNIGRPFIGNINIANISRKIYCIIMNA